MKGHNWGICKKCNKVHNSDSISKTLRILHKSGKIKVWNKDLTVETDERVKKIEETKRKNPKYSFLMKKFSNDGKKYRFKNGHITWLKNKKRPYPSPTEFKKGHKTWNKNLTKETDERVLKYSIGTSKTRKELFKKGKLFSPFFDPNNLYNIHIKPNKKEKLLNKLLQLNFPNQFKYTGNGKFWIEHFNPDFVCNPSKKIIEMFGDYWHRNTQERDKKRLKAYKKYGFSTLIIWEYELKNKEKVINKIKEFVKNG